MTQDEQAVMDVVSNMTAAFQKGQIDDVMTAYLPDAAVLFEPEAPLSGAEQLAAAFTQMSALSPEFTYSGHQVVVAGDTAIHIAPWDMTATLPDGTPLNQSGLSVAVMRKQADGGWKMIIDHPQAGHLLNQ
ncbi:MAG: SgcJ/EcaC family oxidoreductase [Thalassovita sp.]